MRASNEQFFLLGIKHLEKTKTQVFSRGEHLIIKNNKKESSYFYVDFSGKNEINHGAKAAVYPAWEIISENGKYRLDEKNPIAIKIIQQKVMKSSVINQDYDKHTQERETLFEASISNQNHRVRNLPDPMDYKGNHMIFMKFLPQNKIPLLDSVSRIQNRELFEKLSLTQKAEILMSIAMNIHQMHNDTLYSHAFAHLDIKPDNLRINIELDDQNKIINLQTEFCDFGTAHYLKTDSIELQDKRAGKESECSPAYLAQEQGMGKFGPKTDIFSIAPVFYAILGGTNPLSERGGQYKWALNGYNMSGILDPLPSGLSVEDKQGIIDFLKKMGDMNYDARPNSDELLKFTTKLWNICIQKQEVTKTSTLATHSMFRPQPVQSSLIEQIDKEIEKIMHHGKSSNDQWDDKTSRYPQKYAVLTALKDFLGKVIDKDALDKILESNEKYKKGGIFGKSMTEYLVNCALEEMNKTETQNKVPL